MIGDIVGKPGRTAVTRLVPALRAELGAALVVANAENVAGGKGITVETVRDLAASGVDVITSGDHAFDQKSAADALAEPRVLRPANYPPGTPGPGWASVTAASGATIGVVNLMGRVFMKPMDCPFRAAEAALEALRGTRTILVDFHAEATSEKIAMARFLDGKVTAVCGTHTHVATADERVLGGGTAYITDLGMTGAHDSVLGREAEPVLAHFRTGLPHKFELATGDVWLNGAVIDFDEATGRAQAIARVSRCIEQAH